ncbi:MAG TPA: sigma-70 family RNA polymerase sigma factor [Cytophagales bacterium]|nr:sigma-70 family RNA polymerase sigma factor [Cytophagales bacterium]
MQIACLLFNVVINYCYFSCHLEATSSVISELELVNLLKKKDRKALEYLYDNYSSAIYGIIYKIIRVEDLAEEVLQDSFLRFWNKIEDYNPEKGRLFTWMLNIARNLSIDKLRSADYKSQARSEDILQDSSKANFEFSDKFKPDHIGVKDMLEILKPDQKRLMELMYFKGYTQSEISEEFNIPLGTVKTKVRTAMMVLRKLF